MGDSRHIHIFLISCSLKSFVRTSCGWRRDTHISTTRSTPRKRRVFSMEDQTNSTFWRAARLIIFLQIARWKTGYGLIALRHSTGSGQPIRRSPIQPNAWRLILLSRSDRHLLLRAGVSLQSENGKKYHSRSMCQPLHNLSVFFVNAQRRIDSNDLTPEQSIWQLRPSQQFGNFRASQ